ncbi:MAG: hypothetical protein UR26_C0001G0110 [candidate division TM6 bacterium GW2011_GWF2_32_72]|nr:MAG: hypothetical protein UR26_C0001G0110 [candidate division TM6 bacterium GW2011_GWF2_32_72]
MLALITWGAVKIKNIACMVNDCNIEVESVLSINYQKKIKEFIQNNQNLISKKNQFASQIQELFPAVLDVSIFSKRPGSWEIAVKSFDPMIKVGDQFILSKNGQLFERDAFAEDVIQKLNPVYLAFGESVQNLELDKFFGFVKELAPSVFEDYEIVWVDQHNIFLSDKNNKKINLLCGFDQKLDENFFKRKFDVVMQNEEEIKKFRAAWVIDTRFKNQIVFFKKGVP